METKHRKSRVWFGLSAIVSILVVLVVLIHSFGSKTALNISLSTKFGFAQFYAFPVLFGIVGICFFLALFMFLAWRSYHGNRPSLAVISLCAILLIAFVTYAMAGSNAKLATANNHIGKSFKLVEWNALDQLDKKSAKTIFIDYDADIAVFPEFGGYSKGENAQRRVNDIFAEAGIDADSYDVFTSPPTAGSIAPVTIIIKKAFATYELMDENSTMTMFGTVYLHSAIDGMPDIIGLHTSPPLPGMMAYWNRDIGLIAELANAHKNAIILGDFNATMRHGSLSTIATHYDALETVSQFQRGTWPTKLPAFLRSSIDHILLPSSCSVKNIETRKMDTSDHAAIFSELIVAAE